MPIAVLTYKEPGSVLPLRLPVSKSIASRLMLMSALGGYDPQQHTSFDSAQSCTDLEVMYRAARFIHSIPADGKIDLDIQDSGTAKRLLTAVFASIDGVRAVLHMSERLAERPLTPLVEMLSFYGAGTVECKDNLLLIKGKRPVGSKQEITVSPSVSSQVFTAIMLSGALSEQGISIALESTQSSSAYIEMTASLMRDCGVGAHFDKQNLKIQVSPGHFVLPSHSLSEADWSAASYFYLYSLLSEREVYITGLRCPRQSRQGDAACASLFRSFGIDTRVDECGVRLLPNALPKLKRLDVSLADTPDLLPALAVACAMTQTPFCFSGVSHLRHKESDRLEACRAEIAKYGITLTIASDKISMETVSIPHPPVDIIKTYSDHRIAMAFAQTAIYFPGVRIENPECVAKSFPEFWKQMDLSGVKIDNMF